jgi:ABC-type nickel/cobalt efflux system permease component RcnA
MTQMKKIFIFLLLLLTVCILHPIIVSAHVVGQPSFFKINGKLADYYHVPISSQYFDVAQDSPAENYTVSQNLEMEIIPEILQVPENVIAKSTFTWDFGDGTKGTGLKNTHTYTRSGSYLLNVSVQYGPDPPELLESALVNVLPDTDSQFPQAKITLVSPSQAGPHDHVKMVNFSQPVQFDASQSLSDSKIISYTWNFGDDQKSSEIHPAHKYAAESTVIYVLLHLKTENGLIADEYLELDNTSADLTAASPVPTSSVQPVATTSTASKYYLRQNLPPIPANSSNWNDKVLRQIAVTSRNIMNTVFSFDVNSPGLWITALGLIFVAGGLHAVTPGHGKSMMAAFLIGKHKSGLNDVLLLAASITFTHTFVIFILGFLLLYLDKSHTLTDVLPYFEKGSAVLVLFIALTLLRRGYHNFLHHRAHKKHLKHLHDSKLELEESEEHIHTHSLFHPHGRSTPSSKLDLILAGVSGGILPCIDAFSLLILAVSSGRVGFGLLLVFVFSLGLALTIILMGLAMVLGKNAFDLEKRFGVLAEIYAPMVSGIFILVIALKLLLSK